ncbi:MAG: phage holin family protein [Firmicutes bacterium]|nr:phage holin family protein [Bacillota bacterium]
MQSLYAAFLNFKMLLNLIGGGILALIGGWDTALKVLVIMVAIDYITGVSAAWYERRLDSNIGLWGISKKIFLFIPIVIAYWLDILLGKEVLRNLAIFFYISNEGLSILENLARLGVKIPDFLMKALDQFKNKHAKGEASTKKTAI